MGGFLTFTAGLASGEPRSGMRRGKGRERAASDVAFMGAVRNISMVGYTRGRKVLLYYGISDDDILLGKLVDLPWWG